MMNYRITATINTALTSIDDKKNVARALTWFKKQFKAYSGSDYDIICNMLNTYDFIGAYPDDLLAINLQAFSGACNEFFISIECYFMDSIRAYMTRCYAIVEADYNEEMDDDGNYPFKWKWDTKVSPYDGKVCATCRKYRVVND